jgi:hypothetical protein
MPSSKIDWPMMTAAHDRFKILRLRIPMFAHHRPNTKFFNSLLVVRA